MAFTKNWLGVDNEINWRRTNCYQLANRLAFAAFCNAVCHIPVRILYIGFLNGFKDYSIKETADWQVIWNHEYETLGLKEENLHAVVYHIYPDCKQ